MPGALRILIVGGGIAGLGLCRALQQQGIVPDIIERAASWPPGGTGLYLPGNGVRVLEALGLADQVLARSVCMSHQRILDHKGRQLAEIELAQIWGRVGPCVGIARGELHHILLESTAGVRVRLTIDSPTQRGAETVISILDRAQAKIFTIRTPTEPEPALLQADMASWPVPSLALLRGTRLGTQDAAPFWSTEMPRFAVRDGKPSPLPRDQWRVLPMQDLFDALLYLGPAAKITTAKLPAAVCADTAYRQMRRDRMLLLNHKAQADQFDRDCGNQPAK